MHKIRKQPKRLKLEEIKNLIEEYINNKNITCTEIGIKYNICVQTVCDILRKNNIEVRNNLSLINRKYSLNENYFDIIDSEDKAYFLGLLYADGYNLCDNGARKYSIQISLQARDKYILEKFKKCVQYEGNLYFSKRRKEHQWDVYRLYINNKKISLSLHDLGCFQKKSLTLKFPTEEQVPSHLIRHFIRGYIDGDGYITGKFNKTNTTCFRSAISLEGTTEFCQNLQQILKNILKIESYIFIKENNMVSFTIHKQSDCVIFGNWLYQNSDSELRLIRKYENYLKIIKYVSNRIDHKKIPIMRSDGKIFNSITEAALSVGQKSSSKLCSLLKKGKIVNYQGYYFQYAN